MSRRGLPVAWRWGIWILALVVVLALIHRALLAEGVVVLW